MPDFEELYRQYFQEVYRYALSLCRHETVAEEITQETFLKAMKGIDQFQGTCKVQVWLCQIEKHCYFSDCKREKKRRECSEAWEEAQGDDVEQRLMNRESAFAIHKSLHRLPEPYKEFFTLRLFGELSFVQIAELFGKTESWARVTYHRARVKLKEDVV